MTYRIDIVTLLLLFVSLRTCLAVIDIKFEDVNVEYVNGEYIDEDSFDISVNYINDTYNTLRCKAKVIKDFPDKLAVSFKMFGYASGDYKLPMGINVEVSSCDLKTKPIFIAPFIEAIGGDFKKCSPTKGEYKNESFYPVNLAILPNIFPENKYRMDVEVKSSDLIIVQAQFYIDITQ
ncbi:hypothetical protein TKK_0009636 [Trichogramma kaykai]|uniref:MD-2-related lipid-recognition domain-containing protein n=1 Tax=Trichogramma kaykai TaxID=54128 RepID=A0ABD2X0A0_9HYME